MADVVQYAYVWVVQAGNDLCFALKPLSARGIRRKFWRKNLDSDCALQASVASAIHLAHAAGPERRQNLIRPEFGTNSERRWCATL
jgi:hypothetical protein